MKKSLKRNYIYNMLYQVLILITPLITTPYIARRLGADGLGVYSYSEAIASYFVLLATMGINIYGQREISYAQNDRKIRTKAFWDIKAFTLVTSSIAFVLYLSLCLLKSDNRLISLLFLMNIANVLFDISWLYQGMEEFGIIALRNSIFRLISIAFIFIFVKSRDDLAVYTLGLLLINLLSSLSLWLGHRKYVDKPVKADVQVFSRTRDIIKLFIPTIAIQVYLVLDKTMIGLITKSYYENGYYDQAMKLAKMVLTIVTASATVIMPRIGYYFEIKDYKSIRALMDKSFRFVFFLGIPLCLGLIVTASQFVPWFYGPGYDKVSELLIVTSLLILVIGTNTITGGVYMIATKQENKYTMTVVAGALINIVLNAILIRRFMSVGAAVASVAAESSIMLIQLVMLRNEITIIPTIKQSWKYLVAGILMFLALLKVKTYLSSDITGTILMVTSGAAIYFLVLLLLRDTFFLENATNIAGRVRERICR